MEFAAACDDPNGRAIPIRRVRQRYLDVPIRRQPLPDLQRLARSRRHALPLSLLTALDPGPDKVYLGQINIE
jgi:hypothetical protein